MDVDSVEINECNTHWMELRREGLEIQIAHFNCLHKLLVTNSVKPASSFQLQFFCGFGSNLSSHIAYYYQCHLVLRALYYI